MAFVPVRKKLLTRPILKLIEGQPRYVKIEREMFLGKDLEKDLPEEKRKKREPATILEVINLEDGEQAQLLVLTIVKNVLMDEYPNHAYVGKCFSITKLGRAAGKEYNAVHVEEIEDPNPAPVVESATVTTTSEIKPEVKPESKSEVPVELKPAEAKVEPKKEEVAPPPKGRLFGR